MSRSSVIFEAVMPALGLALLLGASMLPALALAMLATVAIAGLPSLAR